jgi:hypothetical protein
MSDEWTEADDVIEEIRETRRELFARLGNDPQKIGAYYPELNEKYADRMIDAPALSKKDKPAA